MALFHRRPAVEGEEPAPAPVEERKNQSDLEEIRDVLRHAALGNLDARVTSVAPASPLAGLAADLNRHLDLVDSFLREMEATLEAAVEGRGYRRFLLRGMLGDFATGAHHVNAAQDTIVEAAITLRRQAAEQQTAEQSAVEQRSIEPQTAEE